MKSTVNSIPQIESYMNKRFNLSEQIINFLASEIYIRNHTCGQIQIMYRKGDDRIFTNKWDFNLRYILNRHFKQCACCGQWYTEALIGESLFSSGVIVMYSKTKGRDVELSVCPACVASGESMTVIDKKMELYDNEILSFSDAFKPLTHIK